jgi:hypothetical protein
MEGASMLLRAVSIAVLTCISASVLADSPNDMVTIPLKDIWALEMRGSGTKDVVDLEPDRPGIDSFRERIAKTLRPSIPGEIPPKPRSAFAVSGTGHIALEEACAVLEDRKKPNSCFSSGNDVSVIFFSYAFSWYVRLIDVERQGTTIRIHYQFVPHLTNDMSQHFAIIPLGTLPDGKYQVEILQTDIEKKWLESGIKPINDDKAAIIISKSFSFEVGCHEEGAGKQGN